MSVQSLEHPGREIVVRGQTYFSLRAVIHLSNNVLILLPVSQTLKQPP